MFWAFWFFCFIHWDSTCWQFFNKLLFVTFYMRWVLWVAPLAEQPRHPTSVPGESSCLFPGAVCSYHIRFLGQMVKCQIASLFVTYPSVSTPIYTICWQHAAWPPLYLPLKPHLHVQAPAPIQPLLSFTANRGCQLLWHQAENDNEAAVEWTSGLQNVLGLDTIWRLWSKSKQV